MATGVRPLSRVLRLKRAGPPHNRRRATATRRSQVVDPPARWQPGSRQVDELAGEATVSRLVDSACQLIGVSNKLAITGERIIMRRN